MPPPPCQGLSGPTLGGTRTLPKKNEFSLQRFTPNFLAFLTSFCLKHIQKVRFGPTAGAIFSLAQSDGLRIRQLDCTTGQVEDPPPLCTGGPTPLCQPHHPRPETSKVQQTTVLGGFVVRVPLGRVDPVLT